jgi:hypothetical protein
VVQSARVLLFLETKSATGGKIFIKEVLFQTVTQLKTLTSQTEDTYINLS